MKAPKSTPGRPLHTQASRTTGGFSCGGVQRGAVYGSTAVASAVLGFGGTVFIAGDRTAAFCEPSSFAVSFGALGCAGSCLALSVVGLMYIGSAAKVHAPPAGPPPPPLALWKAAEGGDAAEVGMLLAAGADKDETNPTDFGSTPVFAAAEKGHVGCAESLIATRADLDKPDTEGRTPLWIAAQNGNEPIVKILIAAGANVDNAANRGTTPLSIAANEGHALLASSCWSGAARRSTKRTPTGPRHY